MKGLCRTSWLWLFLLLLLEYPAAAQSPVIVQLKHFIEQRQTEKDFTPDIPLVDRINTLAHAYYGVNADSAFYYGKLALAYAEQLQYLKGQSESWRMIGNTYELIGDYPNMLSCYHHSLDLAERMHDTSLIAKAELNTALFYQEVGEYDEALKQMTKVRHIYESSRDSLQLAYVLSNESDISFRKGQYDSALQSGEKALKVAAIIKDTPAIASFNNDIGKILALKGLYKEALQHHLQSLEYYQRANDRLGKTETTTFLANTWLLLKNYPEALRYAQEGLTLAREIHRKKEINEACKVLADIYRETGDYQRSLEYYKLYKDFSDSLFSEQARKQTFAMEARFETARKEAQQRREEEEREALRVHTERTHILQRTIALLLIIFMGILIFVLLRSRADKQRTNQLLQVKNEEIERQKEEMEHQAVQLLLNNQQKDKLFSIIAHDLKGPLNSLKGLLDLLKEKALSEEEINGMMGELRRNVDYSAELVSNLLYWASSQLNGIVVTPVYLDLRQMIQDTLTLFVKQAMEKRITILNEVSAGTKAFADKDMMQVVIRNLISNAVKFCQPGDEIRLTSRRTGTFVEVCVADTGIGMSGDMLEKILRKESITTYGTAKEKGTGLGMLLCREFTEENHGLFRVESEFGKGSRFYFTIPVEPISSSIRE